MATPSTAALLGTAFGLRLVRWQRNVMYTVLRHFGIRPTVTLSTTHLFSLVVGLEQTVNATDRRAIHHAVMNGEAIPYPSGRATAAELNMASLSLNPAAVEPNASLAMKNMPLNLMRNEVCNVCMETKRLNYFPQRNITDGCGHRAQLCLECLASSIKAQMEGSMWNEINCPGCHHRLSYEDVLFFADAETKSRYDNIGLRHYLKSLPDWRWCLGPNCEVGQIHDGSYGNAMTCFHCGFVQCFVHSTAYHNGKSCAQVDAETSASLDATEQASRRTIGATSKICPGPGCGSRIEKNGGCMHMTCTQCHWQFCWHCYRRWDGPGGIMYSSMRHLRTCPGYGRGIALAEYDN